MKKIDVQKKDSVKLYKIRKTLQELSKIAGRGTELITVYIPKGKQLHEVITNLREEKELQITSSLILLELMWLIHYQE